MECSAEVCSMCSSISFVSFVLGWKRPKRVCQKCLSGNLKIQIHAKVRERPELKEQADKETRGIFFSSFSFTLFVWLHEIYRTGLIWHLLWGLVGERMEKKDPNLLPPLPPHPLLQMENQRSLSLQQQRNQWFIYKFQISLTKKDSTAKCKRGSPSTKTKAKAGAYPPRCSTREAATQNRKPNSRTRTSRLGSSAQFRCQLAFIIR